MEIDTRGCPAASGVTDPIVPAARLLPYVSNRKGVRQHLYLQRTRVPCPTRLRLRRLRHPGTGPYPSSVATRSRTELPAIIVLANSFSQSSRRCFHSSADE